VLAVLACARADVPVDYGNVTPINETTPTWLQGAPTGPATATLPPATPPVAGVPSATARFTQDTSSTPTPDATRPSILQRQSVEEYTVQRGDSLSQIGSRYGVSPVQIAEANDLAVSDVLLVGQVLQIPVPNLNDFGPDLKLVPDSDFVYGPSSVGFNLEAFVDSYDGYLASYTEEIPGRDLDGSDEARTLTGSQIVQLVAEHYSLSPRLLLAVLEYQSGWLTNPAPGDDTLAFPIGHVQVNRDGLLHQLNDAARWLNFGYYGWRTGYLISWSFGDGSVALIPPGLNAGTVGVQSFFNSLLIHSEWEKAVTEDGFYTTYWRLYGNPFAQAYEPLVPFDLIQPPMQLPFEPEAVWSFTGGPHPAWDTGSGWAALDFAPPGEPRGCVITDAWATAAAGGLVVRSSDGSLVIDLDGDGYEQTGWVLFYLHMDRLDRAPVGTVVQAGDRVGHPSCEGGVSNGTHLHMARKYNGEWIPADGPVPFVMDGWVSGGLASQYDGIMTNGERTIEACNCRADFNQVARP
jgi:LasA protease